MNDHSSKASLFLMELIIAILIFSLSSALCVQLFAKAHLLSNKTKDLNHAISLCESVAEVYYGVNGDIEQIQKILDPNQLSSYSDHQIIFYYNNNFELCTNSQFSYQLSFSTRREDLLELADINMTKTSSDEKIYGLSLERFLH